MGCEVDLRDSVSSQETSRVLHRLQGRSSSHLVFALIHAAQARPVLLRRASLALLVWAARCRFRRSLYHYKSLLQSLVARIHLRSIEAFATVWAPVAPLVLMRLKMPAEMIRALICTRAKIALVSASRRCQFASMIRVLRWWYIVEEAGFTRSSCVCVCSSDS